MGAYTLPEGFSDFDMFAFGSALLVGGKCANGMFVQDLKRQAPQKKKIMKCTVLCVWAESLIYWYLKIKLNLKKGDSKTALKVRKNQDSPF